MLKSAQEFSNNQKNISKVINKSLYCINEYLKHIMQKGRINTKKIDSAFRDHLKINQNDLHKKQTKVPTPNMERKKKNSDSNPTKISGLAFNAKIISKPKRSTTLFRECTKKEKIRIPGIKIIILKLFKLYFNLQEVQCPKLQDGELLI